MNKAVVTVLAVLIVMSAVVEKGESFIRAGREMVDRKQGVQVQGPLPDNYYYDNTEARRSSRLPSKRGK